MWVGKERLDLVEQGLPVPEPPWLTHTVMANHPCQLDWVVKT